MIRIESSTNEQNERQAKIEKIKLLGIGHRGLERVLATARARNEARDEEHTAEILDAAARARWPKGSRLL